MSLYLGNTKISGVKLGESKDENVVSYDKQNPTTSEQRQARENIDAEEKGLGITGAKIGDLMQITAVNEKGVPTALKPTTLEELEGELELIEEIIVDKEMSIERTKEPSGLPYNFKRVLLKCERYQSDGEEDLTSWFVFSVSGHALFAPDTNLHTYKYSAVDVMKKNGDWNYSLHEATDNEWQFRPGVGPGYMEIGNLVFSGNITEISSNVPVSGGVKITIKAVRA